MAETARPKPVEHTSPRPLILGICFDWGVAMGFGLNFFRTPDSANPPGMPAANPPEDVAKAVASEKDRRLADMPSITQVEPLPLPTVNAKPSLATIELEPPPAVLTTDGGLTGRTASLPGAPAARPTPFPNRQPRQVTPPPIPELMP